MMERWRGEGATHTRTRTNASIKTTDDRETQRNTKNWQQQRHCCCGEKNLCVYFCWIFTFFSSCSLRFYDFRLGLFAYACKLELGGLLVAAACPFRSVFSVFFCANSSTFPSVMIYSSCRSTFLTGAIENANANAAATSESGRLTAGEQSGSLSLSRTVGVAAMQGSLLD